MNKSLRSIILVVFFALLITASEVYGEEHRYVSYGTGDFHEGEH